MTENKKPTISLYLHIPFCVQKCLYCDFLSGPCEGAVQEAYMKALLCEVKKRSREAAKYAVSTVFIGGGTPTVVEAEWIEQLMEAIYTHYSVLSDAEVSIECNPGTADKEKLMRCRRAGVNRLSIGLQSACDEELQRLGRIHHYAQFLEIYKAAHEAGFANVNVDLMSGLPGQSLKSWENTLKTVLALQPAPTHISAYSLIVEEGTPFFKMAQDGCLPLPDEDTERQMYERTAALLAERGYLRYEISNYALRGCESRHNSAYWRRTPYLGFGIGAASLVAQRRFANGSNLEEYIRNPLGMRGQEQELSVSEQMEEFMFLGLRMMEGVSEREFREAFGQEMRDVYGPVIEKNCAEGLLMRLLPDRYALTARGIDVSNYVMSQFIFDK